CARSWFGYGLDSW
nr:immunoglobulin heavy chain junction region [Macaca mulatta]